MPEIPWYDYMKMGMGVFGLSPREFWNTTFREFWAIHDARFAHVPVPMSREDLEGLMARFPDGQ